MTLARKLHPDRFSAMSGKMAAIVAFILGESWTEPEIAALAVTSDGFVLVLVLGTVLLLLVLSVFLPALGNPLVLIGIAVVELWLVLTRRSRRQPSS